MQELFGIDLERPDEGQGVLSRAEILAACSYLLHLAKGEPGYRLDDQDHFANRRIRSVGELIQNQVRVGLSRMERVVRERMTTQDVEAITPQTLINIRPVVAAIKEFFGTSQLSQFMDQTNPLSGLTHKRRLSAMGPGGLSWERAGFEVRDVHTSHYGRMCPIETPEGPNIGLIGHLASYGRINSYGFIETPYRRVTAGRVTDEIVYLAADEEEEYVIAQANAKLADDGTLTEDRVLVRRAPQGPGVRVAGPRHQLRDHQRGRLRASGRGGPDGRLAQADRVDLNRPDPLHRARRRQPGAHGRQHAEAGRAARQARSPVRRDRVESRAARDAGDVLLAEGSGIVTDASGELITVDYEPGQTDWAGTPSDARCTAWPSSAAPTRTPASTSGSSRPKATVSSRATCWPTGPPPRRASSGSERTSWWRSCLGRATTTRTPSSSPSAWCATTCSTSIHIEEHEVDARDTKLGAEEITRDIPNLSEEILKDLDERGIIRIGAEVGAGDVLVGKVTPKGETELTPEERLLRAIFGEKAREVRDTSLKVPHGESGKVIDVRVFSREDAHELPPGVNQLVRVYVAQRRKISEGDKLAGRHGNKGVISKILPVEDMPFLADGTPVDIILNPLGVPSRMNVGQVLESHLGWAARWGWEGNELGMTPLAGNERKTRPITEPSVHIATPVFDGAHWDEEHEAGRHPTIRRVFETLHPEAPGTDYGTNGRLIGSDGKAMLYNGRTGQPYDNPISVGLRVHPQAGPPRR